MRDVLFRGKNSNGDWIFGNLLRFDGEVCIIQNYPEFKDLPQYRVRSSTVCQYTGLTDKNGRKIFEGDIIKRKIIGSFVIGEIVWVDIGFCGFYLKCRNSYYPMGKDNEYTGKSECDEVIGNIFDNPELLKE